jgi:hypothetical protein
MPIIFTTITRVKDWQKLREIYHAVLLSRAQPAGAKCVQVLRDLHDSSQALLIAELPDQDAVCEWRLALEAHLAPALSEVQLDARVWEATSVLDPPL